MKATIKNLLSFFIIVLIIIFFGCSEEENENPTNTPEIKPVNSCEGCHTNYDHLKKVYTPDTTSGGGGCGGDTPHIEPYDRVFMGGSGYTSFKNSTHGKLSCTTCHNGNDGTDDKTKAHSNNFIAHPSSQAETKCAQCHGTIVEKFSNSVHRGGWGQKSMVYLRFGASSFDALPELLKTGYQINCAKCHAGCGECHVMRPKAGGGGLYKGHQFIKTPDLRDHCVTCHTSRGGHAYFGIGTGTVPDVHYSKKGYTCLSCHTKNELHGTGAIYDQRYKVPLLPKCENCHLSIADKNIYHQVHYNSFSCYTCHSQDYNNCGSCHVGGEGARIPSYQGFKIGVNPIPETKPFKFTLLRRSLMAPDSWKNYGVDNLVNFDVRPTYKYTTPHNILRWTSRTQVAQGKACYDNCHIIKEGSSYRNKNLYLFNSDLENWEKNASKNVVVDGKLPASWGITH